MNRHIHPHPDPGRVRPASHANRSESPANPEAPDTGHTFMTRRRFLATGAAAAGLVLLKPEQVRGTAAQETVTLGLIGCGNRGQWIADLFQKHGRYRVTAVADYFADRADEAGRKFGVPAGARFTGLKGYLRLLEQPVDAVVIETPPYFHPAQARDSVEAGKHVFLAKPVAVDVPGCLQVQEAARRATERKLCFLVDFQTRAHPAYQEAVRRVQQGMIGPLINGEASYLCGPIWRHMDRLLRTDPANPEVRLRAWGVDRKLSGDVIVEQNIHALDVATWFLDAAPVSVWGSGGRKRDFLGDCWDHFSCVFRFPGDLLVNFISKQVGAGIDDIMCRVYGFKGYADTHYFGRVMVRAEDDIYNGGELGNLYTEGAVNNIATFYQAIRQGDASNPTVAPSVRSNLTAILGRTAAYRRAEVTWDEMLKTAEAWEVDLRGLKD
ncbi:Gfo/Idh/MocA family oxidoreductase [Limisphaera ngatamarikiensis]|uniref:Gfo/Idh/MocA family oxidoreductase n=1 Tax=Limisphaera ngatamarikiensis TaxID=1324935 RepID=A0A6M1RVM1_9BACT|nr:Gfo/Idh/MocA family oxidoreductase [Limisphaera ngatamarikiensis]NGO39404.1 Gfo/Idh/MocA family oxidoreductase [Limisphaera ngatamarikiensis]